MSQQHESNDHDGNFWLVTGLFGAIVLLLFFLMFFTELPFLLLLVIIAVVGAIYGLGAKTIVSTQQAGIKRFDAITDEVTKVGGYTWVSPFANELVPFEVGPFLLDIDYSGITLADGDTLTGKAQLTFRISPKYFRRIFFIVGEPFTRERVMSVLKGKLNETVQSKLSIATKSLGVKDGLDFESRTQDKNGELVKLLTSYLIDSDGSCFGLELIKVELPPPSYSGVVAETKVAIMNQELKKILTTAEAVTWQNFLKSEIDFEMKQLGISDPDRLTESQYKEVKERAERLYNKNPNTQYHQGLGNNTIITSK